MPCPGGSRRGLFLILGCGFVVGPYPFSPTQYDGNGNNQRDQGCKHDDAIR